MGYALAKKAQQMGGSVTLISGPTTLRKPEGVDIIPVITAKEMHSAALKASKSADIIICTAAVADFKPQVFSTLNHTLI